MTEQELYDRAAALAAELTAPVDGRDGIDGVDGRDGKDADPAMVAALVAQAMADLPLPRDGRDGLDADPALVRAEVARAVNAMTLRAGERGLQGDPGEIGPMPAHEWSGTKLRFEEAPGAWGEWVDLRGPRGIGGGGGILNEAPPPAPPVFIGSYFPNGW